MLHDSDTGTLKRDETEGTEEEKLIDKCRRCSGFMVFLKKHGAWWCPRFKFTLKVAKPEERGGSNDEDRETS